MKPTNNKIQKDGYKKTAVKGLYLTSAGNAWHKSAKREIFPTASGKIRFNGKLYDLQKLSIEEKPKKEQTSPVKKNISIRSLKAKGLTKTQISGLFITNSGLCYNSVSKRNLSVTRGKIAINGKAYNLAKIILETFCKIPVRDGQIKYKNGNDKDFYFENLEYTTTIIQNEPSKTDIIQSIRLYFEVEKKLNRSSILFKYYLNEIASKRGFIHSNKGIDFNLFIEWSKPFGQNQSKAEISTRNGYTIRNGTNAINKYLTMLINECLQDEKNGILTIKDFAKKTPTKTEKNKLANETLKKYGFRARIPLRVNKKAR